MNEEILKELEKKYETGNYFVIAKWECASKLWYEQKMENPFKVKGHLNNVTDVKLIHNKHKDIFQAYKDKEFEIELNGSIVKDFVESYNERFDYTIINKVSKTNKKGEIMKQNTFTPKDLKTGYICKHRDGVFSMVMLDNFETEGEIVFHSKSRTSLKSYDDEFRWCFNEFPESTTKQDNDIVKVYNPRLICYGFMIFETGASQVDTSNWTLLWSEKETVEMTLEEVCQELGKNIKIVK